MDDAARELALRVRGLEFAYGERPVLRGIDLDLPAGGFGCLLGPNGSGKSTLIQLLAGALEPAAGNIALFGRDRSRWNRRALARQVAVVPQRFEVAFPFTVEEVVLLGRVPHRGPLALDSAEDRRVAREAMRATGVEELAGRRMSELSGGEFKRVVVAKALAQQPRLLLLDEPAAHLDIRHQVELYELIERVRSQTHTAVLAAVHDLNLAAAYGHQFSLLHRGELAYNGPLEEVMTYARLRRVFGIDIYVGINELTGQRLFTPMAGRPPESA
jgi:iron complex transport system ATP-binding protein